MRAAAGVWRGGQKVHWTFWANALLTPPNKGRRAAWRRGRLNRLEVGAPLQPGEPDGDLSARNCAEPGLSSGPPDRLRSGQMVRQPQGLRLRCGRPRRYPAAPELCARIGFPRGAGRGEASPARSPAGPRGCRPPACCRWTTPPSAHLVPAAAERPAVRNLVTARGPAFEAVVKWFDRSKRLWAFFSRGLATPGHLHPHGNRSDAAACTNCMAASASASGWAIVRKAREMVAEISFPRSLKARRLHLRPAMASCRHASQALRPPAAAGSRRSGRGPARLPGAEGDAL